MLRVGARVIRAELAARPVQAVLTALVIAVAVGALLVTLHLRSAIDAPFDRLMRNTNGPHLTAVTDSETEAKGLRQLPGVAQSDPPRLVVETPARVRGELYHVFLASLPAHGVTVDRPLLLRGRGLQGPDELVAEQDFERDLRVKIGDRIPLGAGSRQRVLTVVGVAATVRRGHSGWVSPDQARALATPGRPLRFATELRLTDPSQADELASRAARSHGDGTLDLFDWQEDRVNLTDESRRGLAILGASTLLALLAVAFTLATAIGGRVLAQRRQIGLLRAIGLTPSQVTALLLAHYLALALLAAPFGLVGGALTSHQLLADTAALLAAPAPGLPGPALVLGALAGALAVVAAATALPAWRAGRLAVTEALALGRGGTSARVSRVARVARRLHLPVVVAIGAKDAFGQRSRTVMTIASLGLAITLVATAMAFEATIDRLGNDSSLRALPWDMTVRSNLPERRVRAMLDRPEIKALAEIREVRMVEPRSGIAIHTHLVDGPLDQFAFATPEGRGVRAPGETTLGRGAMDQLGVRIGDSIKLRAAGQVMSLRVVGRYVEPNDEGRGAVVPQQGLPAPVVALGGPALAVRLQSGADAGKLASALRRESSGRLDVERPIETLRAEAADIRKVVYGTTLLLLAIAFVNLLTTLLIGIRERERDFAILASIGATPRQVLATVVSGGSSLALPAALIGLPLGTWMFLFMIGITDPADGPDVATTPSWWWFPLVFPAALALSALVSLLAARQATRIHPAPALRAE
jgi:putative ABC transport system permease protein